MNITVVRELARVCDGYLSFAVVPFLTNRLVINNFRLVLHCGCSQNDGSVVFLIESLPEHLQPTVFFH